jgi:dethiobiotin synthetase
MQLALYALGEQFKINVDQSYDQLPRKSQQILIEGAGGKPG